MRWVYLDITRPSIEIHMQVLDLAKVGKFVAHVFLGRFFVHVAHDDDPAFDGADGDGAGVRARIAASSFISILVMTRGRVDFHF